MSRDARTNLTRFYRNLHHLFLLRWLIKQSFVHYNSNTLRVDPEIKILAGLLQVEKNIIGFKDEVYLMLLSKNLLFLTLGSQTIMYKSKLGKLGLLTMALCTLSSNISARQKIKKNVQDVGMLCTWCFSTKLFFSWHLVMSKKMYKNTMVEIGLLRQ